MPFDQYRTVVAAIDRLTTQVGRVADAMATPVVEQEDAPQTTDDDGPRVTHWLPVPEQDRELRARIDAALERHAAVVAAKEQRDRLAAVLREVLGLFAPTLANGKYASYQATDAPIAPDDFNRWRDTLATMELDFVDQYTDPRLIGDA